MRDGIETAKRGLPTVALVTEEFWAQGDFVATAAGMPDIPRHRLPHPVAGSGQASMAELGDLAARLAGELADRPYRAAVAGRDRQALEHRLERLRQRLADGQGLAQGPGGAILDGSAGIFLGRVDETPRIGFVFPGQSAPLNLGGGLWRRRFAEAREIYGDRPEHGVVVASDAWHRGVVGIAAARLVDALGVPVVVIAFDGDHGYGSVRTTADFDVYRALSRCTSDLGAWGGHRAAAGLSLRKTALEAFRASFADAARAGSFDTAAATEVDIEIGGPFRVPSLEDLQRLGPFGEGYPVPTFMLDAHVVESTGVGGDRAHAKLSLQVGQDSLRAFAPSLFSRIEGREGLRLVGELQPDHWIGGQAVELLVRDVLD